MYRWVWVSPMLRIKIDENLPVGLEADLRAAGHDAASVFAEGLSGTPDQNLLATCNAEGRVLITLDLDFSDLRAYPPEQHKGIIVLRPTSQSVPDVRSLLGKLLPVLQTEAITHRLWIVEEKGIRIRGGP